MSTPNEIRELNRIAAALRNAGSVDLAKQIDSVAQRIDSVEFAEEVIADEFVQTTLADAVKVELDGCDEPILSKDRVAVKFTDHAPRKCEWTVNDESIGWEYTIVAKLAEIKACAPSYIHAKFLACYDLELVSMRQTMNRRELVALHNAD